MRHWRSCQCATISIQRKYSLLFFPCFPSGSVPAGTWLGGLGCSASWVHPPHPTEAQGPCPPRVAPFPNKPGVFCQVTGRAGWWSEQCRHVTPGFTVVFKRAFPLWGKREREKVKVVPGFPEREVLCRKAKVLISPGSEFPGCFMAGGACARRVPGQCLTPGIILLGKLP